MSIKPFKFKEFTVKQDRCAMKIGTDSVLLGAWASLNINPFSVLDIGAGTGILSLMLAQRSRAEIIDAVEIDDNAFEQCVENFEQSPWGDRLFCYHVSLDEFVNEIDDKYDLIISNPPFYSEDYKTDNEQRDLARFQEALPFEHLLYSVSKLLSNDGVFSAVIPFSEEEKFLQRKDELERRPKLMRELTAIKRRVSRTRVGSQKSAEILAEFKLTAANIWASATLSI